jgi:hypothetical protein
VILIRIEFQCQSGRAQEVVDIFKAQAEQGQASDQMEDIKRTRILTDLSGPLDTVVLESEVESIDAYFASLKAMFASPQFQEAQAAIAGDNPIKSGKRIFYTIEATYELEK